MASTPDTITLDLLLRVHGSTELHEVATIDLPVTYTAASPGVVRQVTDYSPFAEAGKAIADALSKIADDA
ncbi:hypothetical protein [Nocardia rhizosphaerae]|uniref:Uncharacterized protein n=1 Tax=Nocardia rhizosphaerae TaxID=1691571 RepID=A0ABV8L3R6_9NOCA